MTNILKPFTNGKITSLDDALKDLDKYVSERKESEFGTFQTSDSIQSEDSVENIFAKQSIFVKEDLNTDKEIKRDIIKLYTIKNVLYDGKKYAITIPDIYLCFGEEKTQVEWAKHAILQQTKGGVRFASLPLHYALFKTLYNRKDQRENEELVESMRKFLEKGITDNTVMTFSDVKYPCSEGGICRKDRVAHDIEMPYRKTYSDNSLRGLFRNDFKEHLGSQAEMLFGTNNTVEIRKVFHWLFPKKEFVVNTELYYTNEPQYAAVSMRVENKKIIVEALVKPDVDGWKALAFNPVEETGDEEEKMKLQKVISGESR